MIVKKLMSKKFETEHYLPMAVYYEIERRIGDFFFKRRPNVMHKVRLLNLGCGSLKYSEFCNADEYAFKRHLRDRDFRPDWRLDITRSWNCDNDFWDGIFSQHVLEHLKYSDAIFVFRECLRTLKPGAWMRVSVPSLSKYVNYYNGTNIDDEYLQFAHKALAFSFMSQMHYHKSIWDGDLMQTVLSEIGFQNVKEVEYNQGHDIALLKDQSCKRWESLYVEAQKPRL